MSQPPLFVNFITNQPIPITPSTVTPALRSQATGTVTIFVNNTTGSDSNNGLTTATAFKTLQAAYLSAVNNWDFRGNQCVIKSAAGQTYSAGLSIQFSLVGVTSLTIDLAGSTISTTNADCVGVALVGGMQITVQNATLTTATGGSGVACFGNAGINIGAGMTFGSCVTTHILASEPGSIVQVNGGVNPTVTGASPAHIQSQYGGLILYNNNTVTISGTPNFAGAFAFAQAAGTIYAGGGGLTFSGAVTGQRYSAQTNGVIFTNAGGANFFPGSIAGSTSTGGQYV